MDTCGTDLFLADTFDMPEQTSALIYGAGAFGREVYRKLKDRYCIKCFLDQNASHLEHPFLAVNGLEQAHMYQKYPVIVCVHNANWHPAIARELSARGFDKILFLAMSDQYSKDASSAMNEAYNLMMEGQYACLNGIPRYHTMGDAQPYRERVIRKNGDYVTAWCEKELLYTYALADEKKEKTYRGGGKMLFRHTHDCPPLI